MQTPNLIMVLVLLLAAASTPGLGSSSAQEMEEKRARRGMEMLRESFRAEAEGRTEDAMRIAAQMPQDAWAVFRQGKLLLKLGDLSSAFAALSAAARADPHIPSLLSYVAFAQWQLGDAVASADTCGSALNVSLLDFRAAALLQALPAPVKARHADVLARAAAAAAEAHARGGHTHEGEQAKTCGVKFRRNAVSLTMVSSANSLYFQCLSNLVGSIQLREPALNITIYDMGLDALEHLVASSWVRVSVVRFPFADYPPHVSNLRNYAWKPLVYQHALRRHRSILYQDSGQELWQSVGMLEDIIERDGHMFVMQGEKTMPRHVHPQMMRVQGLDPNEFKGKDMCAGGIQGYRNDSAAVAQVLEPTVACALRPECIAPASADQGNHRFDQACFSLWLAHGHYRCHTSWFFRAYLETSRLKDADTTDVPDGFGTLYPVLFSRRCEAPLSYHPLTHGLGAP